SPAKHARATLGAWCRMLAANLARVVNTLDPHAIVLGGGLSQMTEIYPVVRDLMAPHVFGEVFETEVLPPRFGDSSGVRGAAWLWDPDER
ncbi:MAG: ROK family protein, partial [Gammaproteobacteria bacterium]